MAEPSDEGALIHEPPLPVQIVATILHGSKHPAYRRMIVAMTDATDWAERTEQTVLGAAIARAPALGWNARLVREACEASGLSLGDEELLLPNGARDLAALLSRRHDSRAH